MNIIILDYFIMTIIEAVKIYITIRKDEEVNEVANTFYKTNIAKTASKLISSFILGLLWPERMVIEIMSLFI